MPKLAICLWFDNQAEEAAKFYTSVFKDSKILRTSYYTAETPSNKPVGSVLTVDIEINGLHLQLLNGGKDFKVSPAVSIVVLCKDQEELDYYWGKLSAVPEAEICGWLQDKFGVSWQIVPEQLDEWVADPDKEKSKRVMDVILKSKKLIIKDLEAAYKGK